MIQVCSLIKVVDKTGVVLGMCIKVLGAAKKRIAFLGEAFILSVRWLNIKRLRLFKPRWRKRFSLGTLHRALLIRSRVNFLRFPGIFVKFSENACVIVNKKLIPVSNRVYGPVLKEFCMLWPSLGCVTRCFI